MPQDSGSSRSTEKRHLYIDQQKPDEPLEEPAQSTVTTSRFSRRPLTAEDEYFLALERERASGNSGSRHAA